MEERIILNEDIEAFRKNLLAEEKAENTVEKYMRDVRAWKVRNEELGVRSCTKENVIAYKNYLLESSYSKRSINSMLCSVNASLEFLGKSDCKVKLLKVQREEIIFRFYCIYSDIRL